MVDFPLLLNALDRYARSAPVDLLYVNNSTIVKLEEGSFDNIRLHNVQLSGCKIRTVMSGTFRNQEATLKNLNLQDNELSEVPVDALRPLERLALLDLSRNRIRRVPDDAFVTLRSLTTLKLSDNNLTLAPDAFSGLENSLKNLNLKGTEQRRFPEAVRNLRTLAFLDLSQNGLQELPPGGGTAPGGRVLQGLDSLTALNLERNLIDSVADDAFRGVTDTLSSLSLLNNLLHTFPKGAINSLGELRVLDIGYNLLTELPRDAFVGTPSLTLLALDGNLLETVPEAALAHLNTTLRGLSLGSASLRCDCRLRWVARWIRQGDLQVTSRERNPQFCGAPQRLRDRSFYAIRPEELRCDLNNELDSGATATGSDKAPSSGGPDEPEGDEDDDFEPVKPAPEITIPQTPSPTTPRTTSPTTTTTTTTTTTQLPTTRTTTPTTTTQTTTKLTTAKPTTTLTTPAPTTPSTTTRPPPTTTRRGSVVVSRPTGHPPHWRGGASSGGTSSGGAAGGGSGGLPSGASTANTGAASAQRPPLVLAFPHGGGPVKHHPQSPPAPAPAPAAEQEVIVRSAHRQDNSVVIQWDSHTANILGFRVVYRLFGDKTFKQGPPLEASEREFRIKNVPPQECIIVCVTSLEDVNVTPETVPYGQCREVRTVAAPGSHMDKITIAASAAICGTVVIAVAVFVAASRRRSRKLHTLQQHHHHHHGGHTGSVGTLAPAKGGGLPGGVACCGAAGATPSPGGPLSSLATLSAFTSHKDWDQVSVYSNRSIPRPRVYHMERQGSMNAGCPVDEMHGHASHFGAGGGSAPGKAVKPRSIADGQSQHSFSNHSGRYLAGAAYTNGLVSSRPELRQSRQSLAAASDHLSRVSYPASHAAHAAHAAPAAAVHHHGASVASSRRQRSRSRSRDHTRPASRYSTAGSTHTLNNYCDTSDNWTDHDMEIYMTRNPTTRGGLVPL